MVSVKVSLELMEQVRELGVDDSYAVNEGLRLLVHSRSGSQKKNRDHAPARAEGSATGGNAQKFGAGHHVLTARDGSQAMCGGPGLCRECDRENAMPELGPDSRAGDDLLENFHARRTERR